MGIDFRDSKKEVKKKSPETRRAMRLNDG